MRSPYALRHGCPEPCRTGRHDRDTRACPGRAGVRRQHPGLQRGRFRRESSPTWNNVARAARRRDIDGLRAGQSDEIRGRQADATAFVRHRHAGDQQAVRLGGPGFRVGRHVRHDTACRFGDGRAYLRIVRYGAFRGPVRHRDLRRGRGGRVMERVDRADPPGRPGPGGGGHVPSPSQGL